MVRVQGSVQRWGGSGPSPREGVALGVGGLVGFGARVVCQLACWLGPGFTGAQAVMLGQSLASPGLGFPSGRWGGRQVAVSWGGHEN